MDREIGGGMDGRIRRRLDGEMGGGMDGGVWMEGRVKGWI